MAQAAIEAGFARKAFTEQRDIDRIQYWSNMEVNVRPATPEEAAKKK